MMRLDSIDLTLSHPSPPPPLPQTQVGDSVVSLFRAMDELGEAIFSQTTESVNFTSNNIGEHFKSIKFSVLISPHWKVL